MNRSLLRRFIQKNLQLADRANREAWSDQELLDYTQMLKHTNFNRRQIIAAAAGTAVLGACKSIDSRNSQLMEATNNNGSEIIILGAGFAGLMAAHQLRKQGLRAKIFEARDRVGGRVLTKGGFNKDNMFIELGAEFVDTPHLELINLAKELAVEVDEYVDAKLGLEPEVFFMSGQAINPEKFLPEFRKLAALIRKDTAAIRKDGEFVFPVLGQLDPAPRLDQLSLKEYLDEKTKQGVSPDFTALIELMYLGMYGLETYEQSAYNLFLLIDIDSDKLAIYGDSDESKRVRGGNSRLVEALETSVRQHTVIELGHQLVKISDNGTKFSLSFTTDGQSKTIGADAIICALPFTTLRSIEGIGNLEFSPAKKAAIANLGYATNAKFTVGFKEAFWEKGSNKLPANYGSVYSDRLIKEVRASSNNQKGSSGIILNYLSGKRGAAISPNLLAETLDHLEFLYPGSRQLADANKYLQHWVSDPYVKASYSCYRPKHFTLMGGYEEPSELNGRFIFAGEHMSTDWGGYMEGALMTGKKAAELMATKISSNQLPQGKSHSVSGRFY
jgi:monoamine oxidase